MEYIYKVVCFSLTSTKNNNNKDSNLYNNALNFMSSKSKYIDRNYLSDINNFLYYIFILIKLINESFFFLLSRSTSTSKFLELRRLVIDLYENKNKK